MFRHIEETVLRDLPCGVLDEFAEDAPRTLHVCLVESDLLLEMV